MATVDFPNTPSLNQIYSDNGRSWLWNGSGWQAYSNALTLATSATNIIMSASASSDTTTSVVLVGNQDLNPQTPFIDPGIVYNASTDTFSVVNASVTTSLTASSATVTRINNLTLVAPASSGSLTIANTKGLTVNNTLTLSGTDATTMTFPSSNGTIATTNLNQTFSGTQTFSTISATTISGSPAITAGNLSTTQLTIDTKAVIDTFTGTGNAAAQAIDTSFAPATYTTAEYIVTVRNSTIGRYTSKVLMIADGTNAVSITEYSILTIGTAPSVTVAAGGTASAPQLSVNAPSGATITLVRTLVAH